METIHLEKNQIYLGQRNSLFTVQKGRIWVTIEGDQEDYILNEGQSFPIQKNRLVVLQGLEQALILFDTV